MDQDITKLLPSKDNIHLGKVASPSRVVIYLNENGVPIFIDLNGKGEIVPTVFSLWLVPSLLPAFVCKHDDVSHFVLAGKSLPSFIYFHILSFCAPFEFRVSDFPPRNCVAFFPFPPSLYMQAQTS